MTDTLDTLAGLEIRAGRGEPVRRRLDSEGLGVLVTLPDPEYLARTLGCGALFPDEVRRNGSAGLVLADGSAPSWSLQDLASGLVESWAALPSRDDEGPVYRDLRTVSTVSAEFAHGYALQVLRQARGLLEEAPPAPARRPGRGTRTPDVERKRSSRARLQADEEESSRWWLDGWLSGWGNEDEAPSPGDQVRSTVLLGIARKSLEEIVSEYVEDVTDPAPGSPSWFRSLAERLDEWADRVEEEGLPARPRVPGARRFYGVATEVLGEPVEGRARAKVYTVPESRGGGMFYTDEEIREAAEVREIVARLREQRERLGARPAATGTDGTVVPIRRS